MYETDLFTQIKQRVEKLYRVLYYIYGRKKKEISLYYSKGDLMHEMYVYVLEQQQKKDNQLSTEHLLDTAERLVYSKAIQTLREVQICRSFTDMGNFSDEEGL